MYRFVLVAALLALPAMAQAVVLPLTAIDGSYFPAQSSTAQVVVARIEARPADLPVGLESRGVLWDVEGQLLIRNTSLQPITVTLGVIDEEVNTALTTLQVGGATVATQPIRPRQDPAQVALTYGHARLAQVEIAGDALVEVRVTARYTGEIDQYGQIFVSLPVEGLGLFVDSIETLLLEAHFEERPVAVQTSLSNPVRYDQPQTRFSWYARQWEPSRALRLSYLTPWTALQLISHVEDCPAPSAVADALLSSRLGAVAPLLERFDAETLRFCAALPLMLHGYRFASDSVRQQFTAIDASRYLPGDNGRGPIYVVDPHFDEAMLPELEAMYRRVLLQALE